MLGPSKKSSVDPAAELVRLAAQEAELRGQQAGLRTGIARLESRIERADGVLGQAVAARRSLAEWVGVVESSAVGKLARVVHGGATQGEDRAARAFERATTLPSLDYGEPRRARNAFVRAMTWVVIGGAIAMVLGGLYFDDLARRMAESFWNQTGDWILLWVLLLAIILFVVWRVLAQHYRRHLRYVWEAEKRMYELAEAEREFIHAKREGSRYALMRPQIGEWTRILGHVVHRPWNLDSVWSESAAEPFTPRLPNCVEVAVPAVEDEFTKRSIEAVARGSLAGIGWRTRAYRQLMGQMSLEVPSGEAEDAPSTALSNQIDADSLSERSGLRSVFLRKLEDPQSTLKAAETRSALETAAMDLLEDELLQAQQVSPVVGDIAAERKGLLDEPGGLHVQLPPWKQFLSDIADGRSSVNDSVFADIVRAGRETPGFHTLLWFPDDKGLPEVRTVGPGVVRVDPTPERPVLTTATATENRGIDTSLRIELAVAVNPNVLAVFEGSRSGWIHAPSAPDLGAGSTDPAGAG